MALSAPAFAQDVSPQSSWTEVEAYRFGFFETLQRSQGVTTDQHGNFWYSANYTLIRCQDWITCTRASNTDAIPQEIKELGGNHIGDIDYADGLIYAPIEDGSTYQHPFVGIYTSQDLELVKTLSLSKEWQPDGVPWVTTDAAHQTLITSSYGHPDRINLYDLNTGRPLRQIPMSMALDSVQGGKFWKNHLYMSAKDAAGGSAVYEMDLTSGKVEKLFHINNEISEVEGLSYVVNSDNSSINDFYVLSITGSGFGRRVVLYHWKR